uniref:Phosphopantetheine adenylyltransferase n=1 Tax=Candidatus Aschnera chinzeii TaxID=1485666 RepID=A0AAT9G485_9ENTR|nr:MAG: pantetheine-phosphate adenylyltransferase [Candidatus Aschnera chinzeii]
MKNTVIYPGTFDPITYGHLDIIERVASIFDTLILAVSCSSHKKTMFSVTERIQLIKEETKHLNNVIVKGFSGLTIDFAKDHNSNILIRSIRSILDFEYEHNMFNINNHLMNNLETIFFLPSPQLSFISSSGIKKIFKHGGDISSFIPKSVFIAFCKKK